LPDYIRDNEYILRHYRSDWPIPESLLSIFSIHNETLNIWTSAFIPTPFFLSLSLSLSLSLDIFSLCLLLTPVDLSVRFSFVLFKLKFCKC
jgi:adiponectin receptor